VAPGKQPGATFCPTVALYTSPVDVFTKMECQSHGTSDPERHRRMDGSPGIAADAHDDPRLPR
jgi:hypothetical protein